MPRPAVEQTVRQNEIVAITRELLSSQGIEKVSMEDIAKAVGLTRRTLYAYFKSRDEVLLMVMVEDNKTRWAIQERELARMKTGLSKLRRWGETLYEFSKKYPYSIELQVYWDFHGIDNRLISDDLFEQFKEINSKMAIGLNNIFDLGLKDRSFKTNLPVNMTISHFLATIRAVINRALSPGYSFAKFDPDDYFKQYLELFISAIKRPRSK